MDEDFKAARDLAAEQIKEADQIDYPTWVDEIASWGFHRITAVGILLDLGFHRMDGLRG